MIEAWFTLSGDSPGLDHGYSLYRALARRCPWFGGSSPAVTVGPLEGLGRSLKGEPLGPEARLRLRLPNALLESCRSLEGARLRLDPEVVLEFGKAEFRPLVPSSHVFARIVTMQGHRGAGPFLAACRALLRRRNLDGTVQLACKPGRCTPWRRAVTVRGKPIVGYSLIITEMPPDHSLHLQCAGLGGLLRMGCGFFLPQLPGQVEPFLAACGGPPLAGFLSRDYAESRPTDEAP